MLARQPDGKFKVEKVCNQERGCLENVDPSTKVQAATTASSSMTHPVQDGNTSDDADSDSSREWWEEAKTGIRNRCDVDESAAEDLKVHIDQKEWAEDPCDLNYGDDDLSGAS